jgi:hypothetical protein
MDDILTLAAIICVVMLLIGVPIYEVLKLKWRAEHAERMANTERLRRLRVERELEQLRTALHDLQRRTSSTIEMDDPTSDDASTQG